MLKIIITAIAFIISVAGYSQENRAHKLTIKFNSINQFGLSNGDGGSSYDVQTINGIAVGKWALGLGVGIDNYVNRSIPVFFDVRREFTNKSNRPFIYAGSGLNYTWLNHIQKEGKGLPYSSTPGLFVDAGFGYKIHTKNNVGFTMSAGYSYKQSKELVGPQFWIMPWPMPGQPDDLNLEKINSHFRRIVVRIGVDL